MWLLSICISYLANSWFSIFHISKIHCFPYLIFRIFIVFLFFGPFRIAVTCCFTSVVICLTNSIEYPQYLGTIQGMCQTLTMAFEATAPTLGASIYAWSISGHHVFPFDYRLYWVLWGIACCVMFGLAEMLPSDVNQRKFITRDVVDESSIIVSQ